MRVVHSLVLIALVSALREEEDVFSSVLIEEEGVFSPRVSVIEAQVRAPNLNLLHPTL